MERIEITKSFSNSGSRNDVRMRVVNEFAKESPGYGNKDKASRYFFFMLKHWRMEIEYIFNDQQIYIMDLTFLFV